MNDRETATGLAKPIETVIVPRTRDIGGFEVRRVLPSSRRRMVGPFVFLDQMGPAVLPPGKGLDVRVHPHIGLATVTYLFEGTIVHRDSLGSHQAIRPGELNWMTAGRGITHSERSDPEIRKREERVAGLQIWVALPQRHEETGPAFAHHGPGALPVIEGDGKRLRVIVGESFGARAPVETLSEMFYVDASLAAGATLPVDAVHEERAIYLVEGSVTVDDVAYVPGQLLVLAPGATPTIRAAGAARLVLLGGEPMDGPRHIWWNFVSSRRERIEQAKEDWRQGRFDPVPGDDEFIPLPGDA
ncbi:MAG: pirin family protein [Rhodospirillales bacterium]|nr:MAG: pirin family protein [Rhodospirillales bacterium]